ncbi:MAG: riboflavin synthase subunit alpha [Pseudomonadota bacterium]
MFTGIIAGVGYVTEATLSGNILKLGIKTAHGQGLNIGASVAVDGVCLTAVKQENDVIFFDVISETLSKTTLGSLKKDSKVHIERSLKLGDELGGHLVSGHVHGVGRVVSLQTSPWVMSIEVSPQLSKYIFEKGFISLAGASLTVVSVGDHVFSVALIPETLKVTKFKEVQLGDLINVEVDQSTRTIVDQVESVVAKLYQAKLTPL